MCLCSILVFFTSNKIILFFHIFRFFLSPFLIFEKSSCCWPLLISSCRWWWCISFVHSLWINCVFEWLPFYLYLIIILIHRFDHHPPFFHYYFWHFKISFFFCCSTHTHRACLITVFEYFFFLIWKLLTKIMMIMGFVVLCFVVI